MLNFRRTLYPPAYQQIRQMRQENSMDEQGLLARLRGKIKKIKKNETKETGRFTSAKNLTATPTPLLLTCCEILTKTSIIPPLRLLLFPLGRGTHSRRQKAPGDSTSFQNVVATEAIQVPAETTSEETLLH